MTIDAMALGRNVVKLRKHRSDTKYAVEIVDDGDGRSEAGHAKQLDGIDASVERLNGAEIHHIHRFAGIEILHHLADQLFFPRFLLISKIVIDMRREIVTR